MQGGIPIEPPSHSNAAPPFSPARAQHTLLMESTPFTCEEFGIKQENQTHQSTKNCQIFAQTIKC
jgi:hypothetical protein